MRSIKRIVLSVVTIVEIVPATLILVPFVEGVVVARRKKKNLPYLDPHHPLVGRECSPIVSSASWTRSTIVRVVIVVLEFAKGRPLMVRCMVERQL